MTRAAAPRIVPGNAQNRGDRDYQEDAFGFTDRNDPAFVRHAGVAAVLCDGMGGLQFGTESATLAVDTFLGEYRRKLPSEAPGAALKRAALRANDAVFRFARENGVVQRTGCTLVAVVARGVELHCVHAGDSRAYLFSSGRLERLTIDHTYARQLDRQVEQGQLTPKEAAEHPNRDHLTSNLGRQDLTELDVLDQPKKLAPNDWILLCSDGLHGMLSDREIAAELHGTSQDAAQRLVQRVTDRPEPEKDNVTVVIMQVGADGTLVPFHHTWQSGRHISDNTVVPRSREASPPSVASRPVIQRKKTTPAWVWPLTALPLVLALATWFFWPPKPPEPAPVTAGFEVLPSSKARTESGTEPSPVQKATQASIQDVPNQPFALERSAGVKPGDMSRPRSRDSASPSASSKTTTKSGTGANGSHKPANPGTHQGAAASGFVQNTEVPSQVAPKENDGANLTQPGSTAPPNVSQVKPNGGNGQPQKLPPKIEGPEPDSAGSTGTLLKLDQGVKVPP